MDSSQILTPKDDNIIKDSILKELIFTKNNNNYSIKLGKTSEDKILIKIKSLIIIQEIYYQNSFTLEQLKTINKNFRICDNIDEALNYIIEIFASNKYELNFQEKEKIFLILKIPKFGNGEESISIEMKKKFFSVKNSFENLIEKINCLNKEMNNLKNEIKKIKEENKQKDLIIKELKEWKDNIIKLEEEKKEKEIKDKENMYNIDSKIINKKEELDLLINKLKQNNKLKDKKFIFKLIYRGTEDGKYSKDFHRKCDGIPMTISIIKTITDYKFGGYAEKPWGINGGSITDDENAFIFSLNKMKIYNSIYGKNKYFFGIAYGPCFFCFYTRNNMFNGSSNCNVTTKDESNKSFSGFTSDFELNGGEKYFISQEIETFQIITFE